MGCCRSVIIDFQFFFAFVYLFLQFLFLSFSCALRGLGPVLFFCRFIPAPVLIIVGFALLSFSFSSALFLAVWPSSGWCGVGLAWESTLQQPDGLDWKLRFIVLLTILLVVTVVFEIIVATVMSHDDNFSW